MNIPAIETTYKGYRFRSRLEARWAIFFDWLAITWQYEMEGYRLPSGLYLPDFFLVEQRPSCGDRIYDLAFAAMFKGGCFVEVKAIALSDRENRLLAELKQVTGCNTIGFVGVPTFDAKCKSPKMYAACRAARAARFEFGDYAVAPT